VIRNNQTTGQAAARFASEGKPHIKLLLFGSSPYQLGLIKTILETYGYAAIVLASISELVESRQEQPDLIIMLADPDTPWEISEQQLQMLHELHRQPPLVVIAPCDNPTARQRLAMTKVEDFLCLPLRIDELLLRLEACLSSRQAMSPRGGGYPCVERRQRDRRQGNSDRQALFKINDRTKAVLVRGEAITLTPKEYELLTLLSSDSGKVFSIKAIRDTLWPGESKATATDVQQYIHRLRCKVEKDPAQPCCILTVKGFGYRLTDQDTD
jgi:two-component system KDP operon response regulator KdpE